MMDGFMLILPIMCCIMTGWFLKKVGVLNDEGGAQMGRVVFFVAAPCMIFRFTLSLKPADFADGNFILVLYGGYLMMALSSRIIEHFRSGTAARKAASVLMAIRSNNMFMGMPAVLMLWGESWMGWYGRYMAISIVGFEIFSAVSGLITLNGGLGWKSLRRVLGSLVRNPIVISIAAALVCGMGLNLSVPRFLDLSLKIFGDLGTGLALMTLGMKLKPEELLADFCAVWPDLIVRLLLSPLILAAGFRFFPCAPEMEKLSILVMAMPVAMNTFPMASAMGMDGDYAAKTIMVSTMLSVLTLPLVIEFLIR